MQRRLIIQNRERLYDPSSDRPLSGAVLVNRADHMRTEVRQYLEQNQVEHEDEAADYFPPEDEAFTDDETPPETIYQLHAEVRGAAAEAPPRFDPDGDGPGERQAPAPADGPPSASPVGADATREAPDSPGPVRGPADRGTPLGDPART